MPLQNIEGLGMYRTIHQVLAGIGFTQICHSRSCFNIL